MSAVTDKVIEFFKGPVVGFVIGRLWAPFLKWFSQKVADWVNKPKQS